MSLVECELAQLIMNEMRGHGIVELKEKDGERRLPIVIGVWEIDAIRRRVHNQPPPRPLTHELFGNVLDALGVTIERAVINDLRVLENSREGTFFGRLIVKQNGETFDIDSRPSDAIALAVQKGAPIFVEESVLHEASQES